MKLLYVSTFPPEMCGIATYTSDLIQSITNVDPKIDPTVLSFKLHGEADLLIENSTTLNIRVRRLLKRELPDSYISSAKLVNRSEADLVHVQHEFGIFGGHFGEYILRFVESVKKPMTVTFHSAISNPEKTVKRLVRSISRSCGKIVVHSEIGRKILTSLYNLSRSKIEVIPHGALGADVEEVGKRSIRKRCNLSGFPLITNFGFLSPRKGLEYAIEALAKIVEKHPYAHLLIVGRTHPNEIRRAGESYRRGLEDLARMLRVDERVSFINRFVSPSEIRQYLMASDIYLNPYTEKNQISSGTLSHAIGCGKAIISTPFHHALEALGNSRNTWIAKRGKKLCIGKRGILVSFRDPEAILEAVTLLMENSHLKETLESNTLDYAKRVCTWSNAASRHLDLYRNTLKT